NGARQPAFSPVPAFRAQAAVAKTNTVSNFISPRTTSPFFPCLLLPPRSPRYPGLRPPRARSSARPGSDGAGGAIPDGGVVPGSGGPLRADALRLGGSGDGNSTAAAVRLHSSWAGPPPRLRHRMGRRALGHLHRRHRHVQVLAKTSVGSLQRKMFLAYFMLISVSSARSVAAFAYLYPWKTASTIERYQLRFLLSGLGPWLQPVKHITVEMMMKIEEAQDGEGPWHRH
ncbi:unnamed protein product, partial [Urochloa humidicola]